MNWQISLVKNQDEIDRCLAIRSQVFVEEQGVSLADEQDGLDPVCHHFLVTIEGEPAGAARFRIIDRLAKLQRVCVLKPFRGLGIGADLITRMIEDIRLNSDATRIRLGAQIHALDFYKRLGFEAIGDVYMDAGIKHQDMEMSIKPDPRDGSTN